jgi:hypothetical protein
MFARIIDTFGLTCFVYAIQPLDEKFDTRLLHLNRVNSFDFHLERLTYLIDWPDLADDSTRQSRLTGQ